MNREKINDILRRSRTVEENELIDFLQQSDKFSFDDYDSGDVVLYQKEKNKLIEIQKLLINLDYDDLIEPAHIYDWFDIEDDSFKINIVINKEKDELTVLINLLNTTYMIKNAVGLSIMSNVKMNRFSGQDNGFSNNDEVDIEAMDEEYLAKLNQINVNANNNEDRHESADMLLVMALEELGLTKTAERFSRLAEGFWYA